MPNARICANTASLAGYDLWEAIEAIQRMGFEALSLLAFSGAYHSQGALGGFVWEQMEETERDRLISSTRPFASLALHGPFQQIHLLAPHPAIRRVSFDVMIGSLDAAQALGAQVVTIHLEGRYGVPWQAERREWLGMLRRLGDAAGERGTVIAVENSSYPVSAAAWGELLTDAQHPCVQATLDVGHVRSFLPPGSSSRLDAAEYYTEQVCVLVEQLGDLLVHMHVHDVAARDWRDHRAPGRGIIDFRQVAHALVRGGYHGLLELELEEPDRIPALEQARQTLSQAFAEVQGMA